MYRRFITLFIGILFCLPLFAHESSDTRTLKLYNDATKETLTITYYEKGNYIESSLNKLDYFMRDWRADKYIKMDRKLYNIIECISHSGGHIVYVLNAYRTPETNEKLREAQPNVAKNSLHTKGRAIDFRIRGHSLDRIVAKAVGCHAGGIGKYKNGSFIHIDTGRKGRRW